MTSIYELLMIMTAKLIIACFIMTVSAMFVISVLLLAVICYLTKKKTAKNQEPVSPMHMNRGKYKNSFEYLKNNKRIPFLEIDDYKFKIGDVVTTECGWDLGIVDKTNKDGEITSVLSKTPGSHYGGIGHISWFPTGENYSFSTWKELSETYFPMKYPT